MRDKPNLKDKKYWHVVGQPGETYKECDENLFSEDWNAYHEAYKAKVQRLLNKVNAVTAPHRHGNKISKSRLDSLSNVQIEVEKFTEQSNRTEDTDSCGGKDDL